MSQGLAKKAIYSHPLLTTGTYALEWNAIQNAENIFSSCQQTAKGTSGSSPVWEQLFLSQYGLSITVIRSLKNIDMIDKIWISAHIVSQKS